VQFLVFSIKMPTKNRTKYKKYYRAIKVIRRELNLIYPIVVRRVKTPQDSDGDCCLYKGKYYVRINRELAWQMALETLIHELAHVVASIFDEEKAHTNEWGKAYSRVYRLLLANWEEIFEG
jgi:hypothetical protein